MSSTDACALLDKKLEKQYNVNDVLALATTLEFMPLAIVQAASYISQCAPRCSVRRYLDQFQSSDRKRTSLLDFEAGHLRRDASAKNSIIITWQISFDHIQQIRLSAADLLSLMSFFDPQGIPESLLEKRNKHARHPRPGEGDVEAQNRANDDSDTDNDEGSSNDDALEKDILTLRSYSFISVAIDGVSFEMHSLVQLATRKWLEAYRQQQRWRQQSISRLNAQFLTGEYENWTTCQPLFPHVKLAAAQEPKDQESLIEWASLLHRAGRYALGTGNWVDAESMSVYSLKVRRRVLGAEDLSTLSSMANLASIYWRQGRWDAAGELQEQVIEMSKNKLRPDHPDTLTSMAILAFILKKKGQDTKAVDLLRECIQLQQHVLGKTHHHYKACCDALAQWEAE